MFNMTLFPSLIVAGGILCCAIAIFWLWVSHRETKRRLRRLEQGN
jgi:hypothetical protein